MFIVKENVNIRDWNSRDVYELKRIGNNPNIKKNMSDLFPSPFTEKDAIRLIEEYTQTHNGYAIDYNSVNGDKLAGSIGLRSKDKDKDHVASLECWVAEEYWRKGIGFNAVKLFTGYVFENFKGIERIEAQVYTWNDASAGMLKKAGYQYEGEQRKSTTKDGKKLNEWIFAALKSDYDKNDWGEKYLDLEKRFRTGC